MLVRPNRVRPPRPHPIAAGRAVGRGECGGCPGPIALPSQYPPVWPMRLASTVAANSGSTHRIPRIPVASNRTTSPGSTRPTSSDVSNDSSTSTASTQNHGLMLEAADTRSRVAVSNSSITVMGSPNQWWWSCRGWPCRGWPVHDLRRRSRVHREEPWYPPEAVVRGGRRRLPSIPPWRFGARRVLPVV